MSKVVDHLAELTGLRDRDLLDTTLAGALRDLLAPQRVTVLRAVGGDEDRRWLLRAQLDSEDVAASSDTVWGDFEELAPLDAEPLRLRCMVQQDVVCVPGTPALTLLPLFGDREVAGVVELRTDAPLLQAELRMVGSMLRVYRNFESVLDYSERDTLTGLLNRKTFDETFYKSTASLPTSVAGDDRRGDLARARQPFLGVVDIDHFKQVNDAWGHLIGDEVLLLLSRVMRACFRFHDLLYRFGGEEFVVLLRCSDDDDAMKAFERLRTAVQNYTFPQVGRITVSVGYTAVRAGDSPSAAFSRADQAVYWAKHHGRNRVSSFAALVQGGELGDGAKAGDVELF